MATQDEFSNVGEVLSLIHATREMLARAQNVLDKLSSQPPKALALTIEPTLRMKQQLEIELVRLEEIADQFNS